MTDSETPATAVDAPWVCTSISGISPATAVNAADTSIRTAMTLGTPRASRATPWGSARTAPTTTSTAPAPMTATPATRVSGSESSGAEKVVTARPAASSSAAATRRRSDAVASAPLADAPPAWVRRRAGRSSTSATGATSRGATNTIRQPHRPSMAPARLGPRRDGRIQAAANEAKIFARSASGSAWATSTIRAVSMSASAAPEAARPTTKTPMVGASPDTTWATTNDAMPHSSTGRGPARSVQPPDQAIAMVKVTRVAPVDAPNRAQPSSSRTTVGRIVLTARFSKAARVTSATTPTTTGRFARASSRTGRSGVSAAGVGVAVPEVVMIPS